MPCRPASRALALVVVALVVGCSRDPEIRTYEVKSSPETLPPAPPAGEVKARLLGAIIPVGGQSWFVKFSGPVAQIDPHEKAFDDFLRSLRVPDDPRKSPTWTAPAGWTEAPPRQMRTVTFLPPGGGKGPELYLSEPFSGTLLANVNRWRGEVGLPDIGPDELPKATKEVLLGPTKAYRVDFRGPGGKGGMMRPPFAK
jgi:hypothetical protein